MIRVNDIVFHILSGLYYKCENKKHERWMNMNEYYLKVDNPEILPKSYFDKVLKP